ncbi:VOC family protein [Falsibacillus pallidus]|uniref:VOC family protein n=1 Tax=Falsibacillus pallidus TaxID=493781 RepID=UPI003D977347
MIFEMTMQVKVLNIDEAIKWYEVFLSKKPEYIPHEGFAEWEILPGCWLQVAESLEFGGAGPIRFGIKDIESEKQRLMKELNITGFEIYSRPEVEVKWGTFQDPWGNEIGLFEYLDKEQEESRIKTLSLDL